MCDSPLSRDDQLLANRLRQEALSSRPRFDQSLHDRVFRAVEGRRLLATRPSATALTTRWLSVATIATCLAVTIVVGSRTLRQPADPARPSVDVHQDANQLVTDVASIEDLATHATLAVNQLASSGDLAAQSALLAQDAQLAADALVQRLPIDLELAAEQ